MNISLQANIKCPFFMSETKNLLCCEGFIDGTCMTTKFQSTAAKVEHVNQFCINMDGGECYMAKKLYEKYKLLQEKEERERIEKARQNMSLLLRVR